MCFINTQKKRLALSTQARTSSANHTPPEGPVLPMAVNHLDVAGSQTHFPNKEARVLQERKRRGGGNVRKGKRGGDDTRTQAKTPSRRY